ncbi:hypothetical protein EPO44_16945 [bacterium]|nr:MAG: hypothetical protein EPO44_16945 [bacterium]
MRKFLIFAISLLWLLIADLSFYLKLSDAQVTVTVTPAQADVTVNLTQQFTATVSGTPDQRVTWSVSGGGGRFSPGTIDTTGLYTAPSIAPPPPFATVTATSVADPFASDSASVIVRDIRDYTHANVDNDLWGVNNGPNLQFGWTGLPVETTQIVLSRSSNSAGPWTQVGSIEDLSGLPPESPPRFVYTDGWLVPPDGANDYFYKMDAFSAIGLLLKSYTPVFIPKVVVPQ